MKDRAFKPGFASKWQQVPAFLYRENSVLDTGFSECYAFDQKSPRLCRWPGKSFSGAETNKA